MSSTGSANTSTAGEQDGNQITWIVAEKETRDAAKWFIVALGAVGTVIFGTGPIVAASTFSVPEDISQVIVLSIGGALTLASILFLIYRISQLLVPQKLNLQAVDAAAASKLNIEQDIWYPPGVSTLEQFRLNLKDLSLSMAQLDSGIPKQASEIERLEEQVEDARSNLDAARRAANRMGPHSTEQELVTSIETNLEALVSRLRERRSDFDKQKEYEPSVRSALVGYRKRADKIQAEVALRSLQSRFLGDKGLFIASAVLVIGVVTFVVTLTVKPADAPDPAVAEVGVLRQLPNVESKQLWDALNLTSCESSDGSVPVVILERSGNSTTVRTAPYRSGCEAFVFSVPSSLAAVSAPEPKSVKIITTTTVASGSPTATSSVPPTGS